ncbi:MAG TPA: hypothetical protein VGF45_21170 [Polyangia bacterium]
MEALSPESPEILATLVAENFGDAYDGLINTKMREDLARRVEHALREALVADRRATAALCLQRQALWEATEARPTTTEPLRAEARSRANEAAYLADAIQSLP